MIKIEKVYSWYNVYVNNVLILKNLSKFEIEDILKTLQETKEEYKITDARL